MKWELAVSLVVVLVGIQFVPVIQENPPVTSEVPAPEAVRALLQHACYDCHSHEVRWPWYSFIAPVSWLVAWDVENARKHLNFSTWDRYSAEKRQEKLEEAWEEVEEGEMPLWYYLPLHPEARLSDAEREQLRAWALAPQGAQQSATPAPASSGGE